MDADTANATASSMLQSEELGTAIARQCEAANEGHTPAPPTGLATVSNQQQLTCALAPMTPSRSINKTLSQTQNCHRIHNAKVGQNLPHPKPPSAQKQCQQLPRAGQGLRRTNQWLTPLSSSCVAARTPDVISAPAKIASGGPNLKPPPF